MLNIDWDDSIKEELARCEACASKKKALEKAPTVMPGAEESDETRQVEVRRITFGSTFGFLVL